MNLSPEELKRLREANPDINIPDEDIKLPEGVTFNQLIQQACEVPKKSFKEIKKEYGMTYAEIAKMFGYKNDVSYRNSERRDKIEQGITELYHRFVTCVKD